MLTHASALKRLMCAKGSHRGQQSAFFLSLSRIRFDAVRRWSSLYLTLLHERARAGAVGVSQSRVVETSLG
jgi:hypothetical protein